MIQIRKAAERGHANHGWLNAYHTFSFSSYRDPKHMGFRALRVMNEDRVAPGQGFGTHPHQNMEIVTYVLEGALEHKDSMGNGEVLTPGEFQRMSAGTGITHSEFNPSSSEPVHLYQIWLYPDQEGLDPSYEQKRFSEAEQRNRLRLVASPTAADGSLRIHQDAQIFLSQITIGEQVFHEVAPGRHAWLQVLRGSVLLNGLDLQTSDGAAVSNETKLSIQATNDAESCCLIWLNTVSPVPNAPGSFFSMQPESAVPKKEGIPMQNALQGLVTVVGRMMISTIFLLSAVGNKIPNFNDVAGYMAAKGVPQPHLMLAGAIVFLIVGSVSVVLGFKARIGAGLLLVFLVLATYYFHDFWKLDGAEQKEQMVQFMKNLSMMGTMLFIIANGSGAMSLDSRRVPKAA